MGKPLVSLSIFGPIFRSETAGDLHRFRSMSTCRGVHERGFAGDEPPHAVDRRIFVRSMRVSAMPEPGRDPRQMQVLVEGECRHRPPARGPYFGLLAVGLDR